MTFTCPECDHEQEHLPETTECEKCGYVLTEDDIPTPHYEELER